MAIQDMTTLQRGDIVIVQYSAHQGHTMIVTQRLDDNGTRDSYRIAHCPGPNDVTRVELLSAVCPAQNVQDDSLFAWFRADNDKANLAATLAAHWSTQNNNSAYGNLPAYNTVTHVGTPEASRARGVARQYDHGNGDHPPLKYDGLFRIFKWADKYQNAGAFSANRGTTCCSFVMACHQAAAVRHALGNRNELVQDTFIYLRDHRNPKPHHHQDVADKALRGNANVGTTGGLLAAFDSNIYGIHRMFEYVLREISYEFGNSTDYWGPSLLETLTQALVFDAKFMYTMAFKQELERAQSGWTAR